jgi:hypothetical protein
LSGRGKITSPPVFFCKRAGYHSCTTAQISFLGRGVPGQPPPPCIFPDAWTPLPPWWGGRHATPLWSRSCPWVRGREYSRETVTTPEDVGWGGGIFCWGGEGGWAGTPLAGLGPGCGWEVPRGQVRVANDGLFRDYTLKQKILTTAVILKIP